MKKVATSLQRIVAHCCVIVHFVGKVAVVHAGWVSVADVALMVA